MRSPVSRVCPVCRREKPELVLRVLRDFAGSEQRLREYSVFWCLDCLDQLDAYIKSLTTQPRSKQGLAAGRATVGSGH